MIRLQEFGYSRIRAPGIILGALALDRAPFRARPALNYLLLDVLLVESRRRMALVVIVLLFHGFKGWHGFYIAYDK